MSSLRPVGTLQESELLVGSLTPTKRIIEGMNIVGLYHIVANKMGRNKV